MLLLDQEDTIAPLCASIIIINTLVSFFFFFFYVPKLPFTLMFDSKSSLYCGICN